jgi:hypothetical protein
MIRQGVESFFSGASLDGAKVVKFSISVTEDEDWPRKDSESLNPDER